MGLRASEVCALADMNWRCGEVIVQGKGAREEPNEKLECLFLRARVSDKRIGNKHKSLSQREDI